MKAAKLTEAAQRGNLQAFNRLIGEFQESAYNLAYLALCDQAAAEQATQSAFLRAYQDLPRYRGGSFRVWLLKKIVQVCRPMIAQNGYATVKNLQRCNPGIEQAVLARILALPAELRLVISLVDLEGLGYAEAAAILDASPGTIRSRLAQARLQVMSDSG
jgi:RNA polymerase sigma-70 factor (ECF subfamily)